jgi:putative transposase
MRRQRCFLPSEVYFITIRTVEERFALSPFACPGAWQLAEGRALNEKERQKMNARGRTCIKETKLLAEKIAQFERGEIEELPDVFLERFTNSIPNIIGSCMARAVNNFGVLLYGFVWMSNHGHLLVRAPKGNLSEFMTYLNGQIASEINRFLSRNHHLWARRYSAAQVLDEGAELERLGYMLANPQNARLVESIEDWPGLSSAPFLLRGKGERYVWFNRTAWHEQGRPNNIAPFLSTMDLTHTILPQLESLNKEQLRQKIRRLIRNNTKHSCAAGNKFVDYALEKTPDYVARRRLQNRVVIPTDRPLRSERSPQPLCHTTKPSLRMRYEQWFREFQSAYEQSASQYKLGFINVEFPPGSFAPSRYPAARHPPDPDRKQLLHPTRQNLEYADARDLESSSKYK